MELVIVMEPVNDRHSPIHTPDTSDHVHRQNDGSQYCQLAKNVGRLLLPLVHPDIDLGKVVAMGARKQTEPGQRALQVSSIQTYFS